MERYQMAYAESIRLKSPVSCLESTDASCLFFDAPTALRLQSHSAAMLPQSRLVGTSNYFAILRHFIRDTTRAPFALAFLVIVALFCFPHLTMAEESYHVKLPLSRIAPVGTIDLKGMSASYELSLPIPERWRIRKAHLQFSYVNSSVVDPKKSRLVVRLNERPLAQVALQPKSPLGEVEVKLPVAQLRPGYNILTFTVAQHLPDEKCEDITAPELWTTLELDKATMEFEYELREVPLQLSVLSDFLFDAKIMGDFRVNLLVPDLSAAHLQAAAAVASGVALRMKYRPVHFSIASELVSGVDNILVGDKDFVKNVLGDEAPAIEGAWLQILPLHRKSEAREKGRKVIKTMIDKEHALILVTGASQGEVLNTATFFSLLNQSLTDKAVTKIDDIQMPELVPYSGKRFFMPGATYRFLDMGFSTHTFKDFQPRSKSLQFRLPSDLSIKPNQNIALSVDLSYGSGMREDSALKILLNDTFVFAIPLNNPDGTSYQGYLINLPTYLIRTGINTLEFAPVFTPLVFDPCSQIQRDNLRLSIFENSTLHIPAMDHWTDLPRMELFFLDGFPFAKWPDFRETKVYLAGNTMEAATAVINVIAAASQKSGIPPWGIEFITSLQEGGDENIIIAGLIEDIPQEIMLKSSLGATTPYTFEDFFNEQQKPAILSRTEQGKKGSTTASGQEVSFPREKTTWAQHDARYFAGKFVLNEFSSPYMESMMVLLMTAADSNTLLQGALNLWEPAVQARCKDDLVLIAPNGTESKIWSQHTQKRSYVGEIRGESNLNRFVFANPWMAMVLFVLGILALSFVLFFLIKRFHAGRIKDGGEQK